MAASREERLQMRQRGAGTRKIQEVNFGFSFGSPLGGSQSNSIAQNHESTPSATNNIDTIVEEPLPTATPSVTEHIDRATPTSTLRAGNHTTQSPRRSPRISISRVSVSKTSDVEQEAGRSSKRRRISTDNDISTPTTATQPTHIVNDLPTVAHEEDPQLEEPQRNASTDEAVPESERINGAENHDSDLPTEQTTEPSQEVVRTSRRGRPKRDESSRESDNGRAKEVKSKTRTHLAGKKDNINESQHPRNDIDDQEGQQMLSRPRKKRGLVEQSAATFVPETDVEPDGETVIRMSRRRGKDKELDQPERRRESETEGNQATKQAPRSKRKSLRQSPIGAAAQPGQIPEEEEAAHRTERKRKGKRRETDAQRDSPEEMRERAQAAQSSTQSLVKDRQQLQEGEKNVSTRRRGRPSLSKEQPDPPPEATTARSADRRPEASGLTEQPAKQRRGRPSGVINESQTSSTPLARPERGQDGVRDSGKRREGTVAITVHRLADARLLDSTRAESDPPSDNELDSSDELQTRGKRFPSRTGVNAADVLSQICKEILDKHLTALDNNLASDTTTQAKRAEYVRQRRAIEAYGAQLEGRLFDLSELLDSNFILGLQLKNAKREAAEIRNRLLEVRQQRHEVTLRMDAVRQKHSEEENAKNSRNTLNNALHNLELTLDRNRLRPDEDPELGSSQGTGVAGLEFLLRSVSGISSAAEGSQGGLLRQVKAFNAQLEMTAKKLER